MDGFKVVALIAFAVELHDSPAEYVRLAFVGCTQRNSCNE